MYNFFESSLATAPTSLFRKCFSNTCEYQYLESRRYRPVALLIAWQLGSDVAQVAVMFKTPAPESLWRV